MTIFWVIEFDYASRLHHGAIIRYVNYARELTALGHRVYFGAQFEARQRSHSDSCEWFRDLQETGILSGWIELCYAPPFARARAAALALSPVLSNPILKAAQSEVVRTVLAFAERAKVTSLSFQAVACSFW